MDCYRLENLKEFSYRPDIDGLRAVAVIGVVLFHARLGVTGGFAGVDVFFVISGFLITSLILRDLHHADFSMVAFWERRARRILPALVVVVAVTLIAGWFVMLPFGYQVLGQSTVALMFCAANIQFWRTSGYFDPSAEDNPLLHTWSLSVEEQFYLIVPLVLVVVFRVHLQRWVGSIVVGGVAASLAFSIWLLSRDPDGAFYLLPARAWELGAGCLVVFARPVSRLCLRELIGWCGLMLILYSFLSYDVETEFPGLAAVVPVMGTVLLIWGGLTNCVNPTLPASNRLLSAKPLVFIGLTSYSFYLWHWPFFAFHRYLFGHSAEPPAAICYIVVSFLISIASLHYVERPFRRQIFPKTRRSLFLLCGGVAGLAIIAGVSIWRTRGVHSRMPADVAALDSANNNVLFKDRLPDNVRHNLFVPLGTPHGPREVMVWGDSHAGVILPVIDKVCRDHGIRGEAATRGGYAPVTGWSGYGTSKSKHGIRIAHATKVMDRIRELSIEGELRYVILAFRWCYYMKTDRWKPGDPSPTEGFADALISTLQELEVLGLEVFVLQEVPSFVVHVPKAVALHHWHDLPLPNLSKQEHIRRSQCYRQLIARINSETDRVVLIDALPYLLSEEGNVEFLGPEGNLLYRDEHHLTTAGSLHLEPLFKSLLAE